MSAGAGTSGHPFGGGCEPMEVERKVRNMREELYAANFKDDVDEYSQQPFRGTLGRPVRLITNCVSLRSRGQDVFMYEIDMRLWSATSERAINRVLSKIFRRDLFWTFVEANIAHSGCSYGDIVFDDERTMFTARRFYPDFNWVKGQPEVFTFSYDGPFARGKVTVEFLVKPKEIVHIPAFDFASDGPPISTKLAYIMQNVFTQPLRGPEKWTKEVVQWYGMGNRLYKLTLDRVARPRDRTFIALELDAFTEVVRGLVVKARVGANGQPLLNLALLHGVMLKMDMDVIQFYALLRGKNLLTEQQLDALAQHPLSFSEFQRREFEFHLRNVKLRTKYGKERDYTFERLNDDDAIGTHFPLRTNDGEFDISVRDYFEKHLNKRLRFPHLPLLVMKAGARRVKIPMEMMRVPIRKQTLAHRLTQKALANICKAATCPPREHFDRVGQLANAAHLAPNDPQAVELFRQSDNFGLAADFDANGRPNFLRVTGRVEQEPKCVYVTGPNEHPPLTQPVLGVCREFMLVPCVVNGRDRTIADRVVHTLRQTGFQMELRFMANPDNHTECSVENFESREDVQYFMQSVKNYYLPRHWEPKDILLLFFLGDNSDNTYRWIKSCGDVEFGFPTQCTRLDGWNLAQRPMELQMPKVRNLIAKINTRLGGILNRVEPIGAHHPNGRVNRSNEAFQRFTSDHNSTMFVGIFATKPQRQMGERLTVLSACFNSNLEATKFATLYKFEASENNDFIEQVEDLVYEALHMFLESTKKLPENVLVYRGSLSENVVSTVAQFECDLIRAAWKRVIDDFRMEPKDLRLLYLFVHRDQMRFIKEKPDRHENRANAAAQALNPDRGTIVDTVVTSPRGNDFYLCSHTGIKGTSRPAHYVIELDEWKVLPDDLHCITYCLSFLVQRSVYSTSFPAPLYYAKLQCKRAREYLKADPNADPLLLATHGNLKSDTFFT